MCIRDSLEAFFEKSGNLDGRLTHTPFLVFAVEGANVRVAVVDSASAVAQYPDETPVMCQWAGRWSSDFFKMTAGDVKRALAKRLEPLVHPVPEVEPQSEWPALTTEEIRERLDRAGQAMVNCPTNAINRDVVMALYNDLNVEFWKRGGRKVSQGRRRRT